MKSWLLHLDCYILIHMLRHIKCYEVPDDKGASGVINNTPAQLFHLSVWIHDLSLDVVYWKDPLYMSSFGSFVFSFFKSFLSFGFGQGNSVILLPKGSIYFVLYLLLNQSHMRLFFVLENYLLQKTIVSKYNYAFLKDYCKIYL